LEKNNATITIINRSDAFGDDGIKLITVGGYYEKDNKIYIIYDENEEMGMADCSVMIKVSPDEVVVLRKGAFNSKMIYQQGKTTEFMYHMPYGDIEVILHTKKINNNLCNIGGKLNLFYSVDMQGETFEHSMSIEVKVDI